MATYSADLATSEGDGYPSGGFEREAQDHAAEMQERFIREARDAEERRDAEDRYHDTLNAFTWEHGKIIHEYWSSSRPGGVAVTVKSLPVLRWIPGFRRGKVQFHRFSDYLTREFPAETDELLFAGDALAAICEEVLRGPTQRIALTQVYMAASQLLSSLDAMVDSDRWAVEVGGDAWAFEGDEEAWRERAEQRRKEVAEAREREQTETQERLRRAANGYRKVLLRAERFYKGGAEQSAQFYYFMGLLLGVTVVSALVFGVTRLLPVLADSWGLDLSKKDTAAGFTTAVAGALGASVSVMWRMTAGTFREDAVFGADNLRRLGAFRPFLGAMFGLILYVALQAGVISTTYIPDNPGWYFYIFLAFLAGFSERLVPDFLGDTAKGISPREAARAEQDSVLTQSDEDRSPIITA